MMTAAQSGATYYTKDSIRLINLKSSNSNNNLIHLTNTITTTTTSSSFVATNVGQTQCTNNPIRLDSSTSIHRSSRQLECNKSIDSIDEPNDLNATADQNTNAKPIKRNTSLISFKSLDFNLKTIYSSMKSKHGRDSRSAATNDGSGSKNETASSSRNSVARAPYVRVETVDSGETEHLLTFSQSPYHHRGSFDRTSSHSQYLNAQGDSGRSQTNSPFLSIATPPNIRRSSTSDIIENPKKGIPTSTSQQDNRRPSTSDLLRRARERKGGDSNKIGRSVSQGGLPRGGGRVGRRTSMAF